MVKAKVNALNLGKIRLQFYLKDLVFFLRHGLDLDSHRKKVATCF